VFLFHDFPLGSLDRGSASLNSPLKASGAGAPSYNNIPSPRAWAIQHEDQFYQGVLSDQVKKQEKI
jgi:hypothetical protein